MVNDLKKLLDLQEIDLKIEKLGIEFDMIPTQIDVLKGKIQEAQAAFEAQKQRLIQNQVDRKNKELDVASHDEKIAKHEKELNSLKSNASYKAMIGEIDLAKREKTKIEDVILNLMEGFDQITKELKTTEGEAVKIRQDLENEIKVWEEKGVKLKVDLEQEAKKREAFIPNVEADLLSRYDFIRINKKSKAIAPIAGETCTGCNTNLTHSTLNETRKGKEIITCESCSRILYYVPAQPPATPA